MSDRRGTIVKNDASSVTGADDFKATNALLNPRLKEDYNKRVTISFSKFLHGIGGPADLVKACGDRQILEIQESVKELYDTYNKSLEGGETGRYQPFCDLSNGVLDRLSKAKGTKGKPIMFVRNDPLTISGNFASKQKPDVAVVPTADHALGGYTRFNPDSFPFKPQGRNLTWYDVLFVFEFRYAGKKKGNKTDSNTGPASADSGKRDVDEITERLSGMEIEEKRAEINKDYKIQLIRYNVNQLSVVFNRRHGIHFLVTDNLITATISDHAGYIQTTELDFGSNLPLFIVFLKRLAELDGPDVGFVKGARLFGHGDKVEEDTKEYADTKGTILAASVSKNQGEQNRFSMRRKEIGFRNEAESFRDECCFTLKMEGHSVLVEDSIIGRPPFGLVGRGSGVHGATVFKFPGQLTTYEYDLVVKTSWQLCRRESEKTVLQRVRAALVRAGPSRDGKGTNGTNLADSLPVIVLSEEYEKIWDDNTFRKRVGITEQFEENRIWRAILLEKLDAHLCLLKDEKVFRSCFREIFEGTEINSYFFSPSE